MPDHTPSDNPKGVPSEPSDAGCIGRYKILGELGRGGCGVVYRALDPSIGRVVAIKTIIARGDSSAAQNSRERFRREARSAGNLSHPNIVTVHDFNDSCDPMFIAMEFIKGRTLADYMASGPLALDFSLGVLRAAAGALDYAHSHQIVHRDVKPANFLINESGHLKITDFGIAKILDSDEGLTSTGMIVGTAQYMSPEQIAETVVTGRSDQFSLAVIAYEMLTGFKPFQGNSWASMVHAIMTLEPQPVAKYRKNLGEPVTAALRKALSKDPTARFSSCIEFCNSLEHAILGSTFEGTAIMIKPGTTLSLPPLAEDATLLLPPQQTGKPNVTREVLPEEAKRKPEEPKRTAFNPLLIGALAGIVIAGGLWFGLRGKHAPSSPATSAPPEAAQKKAPEPLQSAASDAAPTPRAPQKTAASSKAAVATNTPLKSAEPASPVTNAAAAPSPVVESTPAPPVSQAAPPPTVTPPPQPVPNPVDQAKRAADEQARQAADERAKRLADEQTKRAADDQARRAAEEQAKNEQARNEQAKVAHSAELQAISRVLAAYQDAYNRKDFATLQQIWPSIPKQTAEGIRSSFRDASEISMELRSLGEPKIAGATAIVICDRNLHQVILKRALQASGQVRIVLNRTGSGWIIQSVDSIK